MDPRRFDDIAGVLGTGAASRRQVLRGGLAGGAAGLATMLGLGSGSVSASAADQTCQAAYDADPRSIVSKNACAETGPTRCGTGERGFCVQTIGHIPRCVTGFNPALGRRRCPTRDACDRHGQCPNGTFCAKVEGCCGRPHNTCLRRYP